MSLKRRWGRVVAVAALVGAVAIGVVGGAGAFKHVTKRPSKVSLHYRTSGSAAAPYNQQAVIKGRVKAKGPGPIDSRKLCRKNRPVRIKGIGKTKSDKHGQFSIPLGSNPPSGTFRAKVPRKKAHLRRRQMTCFAATSKAITIP